MTLQFPVKWQTEDLSPLFFTACCWNRNVLKLEAAGNCDWIMNNTVFTFCQGLFVITLVSPSPPSLLPLLDHTSLSHSPSPPAVPLWWSWQLWSAHVVFYWRLKSLLWCGDEIRVSASFSPHWPVSLSEQLRSFFLAYILLLVALGDFRKSQMDDFYFHDRILCFIAWTERQCCAAPVMILKTLLGYTVSTVWAIVYETKGCNYKSWNDCFGQSERVNWKISPSMKNDCGTCVQLISDDSEQAAEFGLCAGL